MDDVKFCGMAPKNAAQTHEQNKDKITLTCPLAPRSSMSHLTTSIHAQAGLHRKLVLFCAQLEGYLRHFPNCHKYALTQSIRVALKGRANYVCGGSKTALPKCPGHPLVANSGFNGPIFCSQSHPVNFNQNTSPLISKLLRAQRPSHIFRRIRTIVVDSFKRVSTGWRAANICQKRQKRLFPFFTQNNSPAPVIFVKRGGWIQASLLHRCPSWVHWIAADRIFGGYAFGSGPAYFGPKASARFCASMPKPSGRNACNAPAVAIAAPSNKPVRPSFGQADHNQAAKSLASQINCFLVHQ